MSASSAGGFKGACSPCYLEPEGAAEKLNVLVEEALPVFEAAGDDLALYIAYTALAQVAGSRRGQMDAALERQPSGPSPTLGRRATCRPGASRIARAACRFFGTTPVSELLVVARRDRATRKSGSVPPRLPRRVAGDARALRRGARDPRRSAGGQAERGGGALLANLTAFESVWVELWAGDPVRRGRVRSRRFPAARGARGAAASSPTLPSSSLRRSTRSTGSTRPTRGPTARRSSATGDDALGGDGSRDRSRRRC